MEDNDATQRLVLSRTAKPSIHAFFLTDQNAFQLEQARAAEAAAQRHGFDITVRYAESNALVQIHQLFESIHGKNGAPPDAIVVETMTSDGMPRVARNAAEVGIAWAVLNSEADYLAQLRSAHPGLPIFGVGVDNYVAGQLQGAQLLALLGSKQHASVLCVQGATSSAPARERHRGMSDTIAGYGLTITYLDADWTVETARSVVTEWLRLGRTDIDLVVGQNDENAEGARRAMIEHFGRNGVQGIPFIGCDGLPEIGRALVDRGALAATLITPPSSEPAVDALARYFVGAEIPQEHIQLPLASYPPLERLETASVGRPTAATGHVRGPNGPARATWEDARAASAIESPFNAKS